MHLCIQLISNISSMRVKVFCLFLIYFFFEYKVSYSQVTTPFSSLIPVGEISDNSFANNLSMGGLGISNGSYWHLNNQNPAALVYNRFTTFEMGVASNPISLQLLMTLSAISPLFAINTFLIILGN